MFKGLKSEVGFSLIELILVMSLIGIMAFTAMPALMNVQAVTLDGASRKVESDVRYAQNLAMTTGDAYGVRSTGGVGGTVYEVYNVATDAIVSSPYDHMPMTEDFNEANAEFAGVVFTDDDDVQFDAQGAVTVNGGDGTFVLENDEGEQKEVSISATGLVSIN